jgi:hypothetical protein
MIKETTFHVKFYLKSGREKQAVIEDDGLSINDLRQSIQTAIDEDDYYVVFNIIDDEWTVIKADRIEAFSIIDAGRDSAKVADWGGFDFK